MYFFVNLSCVLAFVIRDMPCDHLQHAHAEGPNIDLEIVFLVVHLGGHKLGGSQAREGLAALQGRGEAQVADPDLGGVAVDENVVAFQISVNYFKRFLKRVLGHKEI